MNIKAIETGLGTRIPAYEVEGVGLTVSAVEYNKLLSRTRKVEEALKENNTLPRVGAILVPISLAQDAVSLFKSRAREVVEGTAMLPERTQSWYIAFLIEDLLRKYHGR